MLVGKENLRVESECKEAWSIICCGVKGLLPVDSETKRHGTTQ